MCVSRIISHSSAAGPGPAKQRVQRQADHAATLPQPTAPDGATHAAQHQIPRILHPAGGQQITVRPQLALQQLPRLAQQRHGEQRHLPTLTGQLGAQQPFPDAR